MQSYAIILGGVSGRRMEADRNKVFLPLRGIPAIVRAIAPFSALCAGAVVVAAAAEVEEMRAVIARCGLDRFVMRVVPGGAERQDSVRCGLDALPDDAECVLIHDGARALVTEDVIRRALEYYREHPDVIKLLRTRGMQGDYSWTHSAGEYVKLYEKLTGKK